MTSIRLRPEARWLALWAVAVVLGLLLATAVIRDATHRHLVAEADSSARAYADLLQAGVPGLHALLREGRPDRSTLEQLKRLRTLGDVFRFKMFGRDGRLLLVSDDLDRPDLGGGGGQRLGDHHSGPASSVVQSLVLGGANVAELKDGTGKPNRPALYSEAYVPVRAGGVVDGAVIGVVEVYVDQTARRAGIRRAFATVGVVVAGLLLALGAMGAWHWLRRLREQRKAEDRVRYLARHDVLSGALNRASFAEALEQAAWRHREQGSVFAVLCLDLDRFKEVNDSLGHSAGDELLRQATARLRQLVRHGDELARLGGDEFALLQAGVDSAADVSGLAARVVQALAEPYELQGQRVFCGASVGAAIYATDAHNTPELMHKADLALYRAKSSGRGTFSFYDAALDRQLQQRHDLVRDLRQAIQDEALHLHYQPLFEGDGSTLSGYEALLRWQHPTRGPVSPAEFIPLAEDTGLITPLGAWVLQRACRDAAAWPDSVSVSVNLSAAQFKDGQLVNTVVRALHASGLNARRLELEITESLLMGNTEPVVKTLHTLGAMGVRIAMDDFGTGYSSLAYLWRFPFDKVKIDRAFTQGLTGDPKVNLIVRSIISLAHSLQIRVNAEGVETAAQMQALQQHGCDELQGFLLGRPAPNASLSHANAVAAIPGRPLFSALDRANMQTLPMPL